MSLEHGIQNKIRNALAGLLLLFRINTGKAWTGNDVRMLPDGSIIIKDPRPFSSGVPKGFSDLFGVQEVTITPDMVGKKIGVAVFGEVKSERGQLSAPQAAFLQAMSNKGARAGVWRSVDDALRTLGLKD